MTTFIATNNYQPKSDEFLSLNKNEIVEVLDSSKPAMWLVRKSDSSIGFVEPDALQEMGGDHGNERTASEYVLFTNFDLWE